MKNYPVSELIIYLLTAIFFSVIAGLLSIITGPQISHIINGTSLLIVLFVLILFLKDFKIYRTQFQSKNISFIILIVLMLSEFLLAIFLIGIRYGYTNWNYKYFLLVQP